MITFAIGLGCDRGTSLETVSKAVEVALALVNAVPDQVVAAASITLKMDEAALLALAQQYDWPLQFYPPEQLAGVQVPNPSETVRRHTGTPSVSEAAALLAAGPGTPMSALVVEKYKYRGEDGRNATVSIARKTQ
jgi:cobalt-precorrin 5A hydrolase